MKLMRWGRRGEGRDRPSGVLREGLREEDALREVDEGAAEEEEGTLPQPPVQRGRAPHPRDRNDGTVRSCARLGGKSATVLNRTAK